VLTGETGAGKSILLDSLGLALGQRAEAGMVRAGQSQASVVASFHLPNTHPALALLAEQGIVAEDDLVLRRVVQADGRSRAFVNDDPVGVGLLRRLGALLVEVQGQHDQVGLADRSGAAAGSLAYGQKRALELALALALDPRLLLLDEPTAGMNQTERAEISALMKDLRSQGLCQLLVEHDVQMMIDTCDYVFAMNTGQLIAQGEPREVVQNPLVQEAYLGRKWREHAADR